MVMPSILAVGIFIYGFIGWSVRVSFTNWRGLLPSYEFVGFKNYIDLRITSYNVCYTKLLRPLHDHPADDGVHVRLRRFGGTARPGAGVPSAGTCGGGVVRTVVDADRVGDIRHRDVGVDIVPFCAKRRAGAQAKDQKG